MDSRQIRLIAEHYGEECSFEKLVKVGTVEFNGLRYENTIPWSTTEDTWVPVTTRITGSTLKILEDEQIRNFRFARQPTLDYSNLIQMVGVLIQKLQAGEQVAKLKVGDEEGQTLFTEMDQIATTNYAIDGFAFEQDPENKELYTVKLKTQDGIY